MSESLDFNTKLLLICGKSGAGKSYSFKNIPDQKNWWFLNTEAGKALPYRNQFDRYVITDPDLVTLALEQGTGNPDCHGIIVDSLTFLMDMYESTKILAPGVDTRKAWSFYQQYFKTVLQQKVPLFNKPVIFTAHLKEVYNESTMEWESTVPIKGALAGNGVEAYFNQIVYAKKMPVKKLEKFEKDNKLLHITDRERKLGFKHVFQTMITADAINEKIRGPEDMFTEAETYIDNDVNQLLQRIDEYYGSPVANVA